MGFRFQPFLFLFVSRVAGLSLLAVPLRPSPLLPARPPQASLSRASRGRAPEAGLAVRVLVVVQVVVVVAHPLASPQAAAVAAAVVEVVVLSVKSQPLPKF